MTTRYSPRRREASGPPTTCTAPGGQPGPGTATAGSPPPHVFRKTAISEWKRMGLMDLHIADLAGHAKVSMTQDVYFDRNRIHPEAAHRVGY